MISNTLTTSPPVIHDVQQNVHDIDTHSSHNANTPNICNLPNEPVVLTDDTEIENVTTTTVHIMQSELERVQKYVQMQHATANTTEQYEFSETFTAEMGKYGKMKKKKRAKKSPYDKPKEYKNGMTNFVAFTSHFLPYFEGGTNKPFRNLLWDIYKGIINTWFENCGLGKIVAKELGREKYTEKLKSVAPKFKTEFPDIVAKLDLFDATLSNDEHRVKILTNQKADADSSAPCVGAVNASMPIA